jgi:hypothetical protein
MEYKDQMIRVIDLQYVNQMFELMHIKDYKLQNVMMDQVNLNLIKQYLIMFLEHLLDEFYYEFELNQVEQVPLKEKIKFD